MDAKVVGRRLKHRREQLDFSIDEVVDRLSLEEGKTRTARDRAYRRWEKGGSPHVFKEGRIARLARALDTSPAYLVGVDADVAQFPAVLREARDSLQEQQEGLRQNLASIERILDRVSDPKVLRQLAEHLNRHELPEESGAPPNAA